MFSKMGYIRPNKKKKKIKKEEEEEEERKKERKKKETQDFRIFHFEFAGRC